MTKLDELIERQRAASQQPPPTINPEQPVRPLAEWLCWLGQGLHGYCAARTGLVLRAHHEINEAKFEAEELQRSERRAGIERSKYYWLKDYLEETYEPRAKKALADCAEAFDMLNRFVDVVTARIDQVLPIVRGLHVHLAGLSTDADVWKTELATLLLSVREMVWTDFMLFEQSAFANMEYFEGQPTLWPDHPLFPLIKELAERAKTLEAVALPDAVEKAADEPQHSEDFTSVNWYGQKYQFTQGQALCIKCLWEAYEQGTPTLREKTIGERIRSASDHFRLSHAFRITTKKSRSRQHPAWGNMIIRAGKGTYRLTEPKPKKS